MSDELQAVAMPLDRGLDRLDDVHAQLEQLICEAAQARIPAELATWRFDGKASITELVDDVGAPALSYSVFNPTKFKIFVAIQGGPPRPGAGALEVPAQRLVTFPFAISGHIGLGVDPEEIGEGSAVIQRARHHQVQSFFVGALA